MCIVSQDILDKLNATVEQFVQEGRMFTGYDVTLETREREGINLRHKDVRGDVHDLPGLKDEFEFGDYERSRVDMPQGGWAWVYHKNGDDPTLYTPRQMQKSPAAQQAAPAATATQTQTPSNDGSDDGVVSDSGGVQDDGTYATDHRGRLMVPKSFLETAKLSAGDDCYVHHDIVGSKLVLTSSDQSKNGFGLLGTYRVEHRGNIRLSSKTLLNLSNSDKFNIEQDGDKIAIQSV